MSRFLSRCVVLAARAPALALAVAVTVASATACSSESSGEAAASTAQARPSKGMPFAIDKLTESFEGTASEVLQVSGYTYVAVTVTVAVAASSDAADGSGSDTPERTRWVVSLAKEIHEGAHVKVRAFGKKDAFESKKLGRTFDTLWFAIVTETEGASS